MSVKSPQRRYKEIRQNVQHGIRWVDDSTDIGRLLRTEAEGILVKPPVQQGAPEASALKTAGTEPVHGRRSIKQFGHKWCNDDLEKWCRQPRVEFIAFIGKRRNCFNYATDVVTG